MVWTGFIWLRIGSSDELLWTWLLIYWFHEGRWISWVPEQLLASKECVASWHWLVSYDWTENSRPLLGFAAHTVDTDKTAVLCNCVYTFSVCSRDLLHGPWFSVVGPNANLKLQIYTSCLLRTCLSETKGPSERWRRMRKAVNTYRVAMFQEWLIISLIIVTVLALWSSKSI
jgi:hypothetical protein